MNKEKFDALLQGMRVDNWELREHSNGKRKLYARFVPDIEPIKAKVVEPEAQKGN
jgi:hypothetical protein